MQQHTNIKHQLLHEPNSSVWVQQTAHTCNRYFNMPHVRANSFNIKDEEKFLSRPSQLLV